MVTLQYCVQLFKYLDFRVSQIRNLHQVQRNVQVRDEIPLVLLLGRKILTALHMGMSQSRRQPASETYTVALICDQI